MSPVPTYLFRENEEMDMIKNPAVCTMINNHATCYITYHSFRALQVT